MTQGVQRALSTRTPEEFWTTIPPTAAIRDLGSAGWNGGVEWENVKDDWRVQFYPTGRSRHTRLRLTPASVSTGEAGLRQGVTEMGQEGGACLCHQAVRSPDRGMQNYGLFCFLSWRKVGRVRYLAMY